MCHRQMKILKSLYILLIFVPVLLSAQEVSESKMAEIYEQVKTPYKYGLVVAPATNDYKTDCPTVFRHKGKWYMTYLVYNGRTGTDGRGYETKIAESDDLLHWTTKGNILSFKNAGWDMNQRGGFPALQDIDLNGNHEPETYRGKYWMSYIGGAEKGYESGPLSIGIAWTGKKNSGKPVEWQSFSKPVLSVNDADAHWFENLTQYKSTIFRDRTKKLGAPFIMFYNAGGKNPVNNLKGERIGIALSNDMKKWRRFQENPVFGHEIQGMITGDAQIQKFGDVYVMFYFSAFNPKKPYKAYNTFACSYDLIHWTDWQGEDLIIPSKDYDNLFAHKSFVLCHEGIVYHYYCAVNKFNQRGIAVATSKALGKSSLHFPEPESKQSRILIDLDKNWTTRMGNDSLTVNLPHNWDDYFGYRQLRHGNLHGTAIYSKTFTAPLADNKQFFLRFEGVGTFATVELNGKTIESFPAGRTTTTLDVSKIIIPGGVNTLKVTASHPEIITNMPWVCGGCSSESGFSEGSQPLGIFRPVTLEITDKVRIEPFGVHIWHNDNADSVFIETEIKNYSSVKAGIELVNKLNNEDGISIFRLSEKLDLGPGETKIIRQSAAVKQPVFWSTERPCLYKLASMIKRANNVTADELTTDFGFRTISWPVKRNDNDGRFYLNGKPVLINGTCEYEHQFGQSHAFSKEQIASRIKQIQNAGFNAFRDAHQPHNSVYQKLLDEKGMLYWPQFSAHIWYDTPEFRENFKKLLRQWVKEHRNSPSVIMWGLQNESVLPEDFARECSDIIREMDPTTRSMRVITTCNGGTGTDWNVIQNWSGTYGGNIDEYGNELKQKTQLLNGEYGAWRTLGFHTEPAKFDIDGAWSENRACQLLETKIRLAESVKDSVCGHFQWVFSSHDNPGRIQPDEMYRCMDKAGPFNNKGLVSPWEEPTDAYYLYKSNYVTAARDPLVYIVSHTWPDRFTAAGRSTVEVYSNCDSVKLYNDAADSVFLGKKVNKGVGTHFVWENREIRYNVLRAVGFFRGKAVCEDIILLNHLEMAPHYKIIEGNNSTPGIAITRAEPGYNYLYRLNCGGNQYTDKEGQIWLKDDTVFSRSWASAFSEINPFQASQRVTFDPIGGTNDRELFGNFRFGRHKLKYTFAVPDGRYRIELYFVEPWHGTGGGEKTDCEGLRIFDVAVNDSVVINDLDIWAECGHDNALKKVIYATVKGGQLIISFPEVKAGQALISAIAIATTDQSVKVRIPQQSSWSWTEADKNTLEKTPKEFLPVDKEQRSISVYAAAKALVTGKTVKINIRQKEGVKFCNQAKGQIQWTITTGLAQIYALRFNYMNTGDKPVKARMQLITADGIRLRDDEITFPVANEKWKIINTTTLNYINAGVYKVVISAENADGLSFESLEVQ